MKERTILKNIESLGKTKNQFLAFGLLPFCTIIVINAINGINLTTEHNSPVVYFTFLFLISFWVMAWRFSRVLGVKIWQFCLILSLGYFLTSLAILVIIIFLMSIYWDIVKLKGNTEKSETTPNSPNGFKKLMDLHKK